MKVAVTGATGFIGRYVLNQLCRHQVEIIAVTRNPHHILERSGIKRIVRLDIADPGMDCFERLGRPDVLIHLAWGGLPNYRSLHHFEKELPVQFRFLKNLIDGGLSYLFVTGSCFEYGMQSGPLSPNCTTTPSNPYGYAKDALRKQLEFLKDVSSYSFAWGRVFYVYGEGQSSASLYSQLKEAVTRGDKVFNMSGGEQLRDYLSVDEVARRIVERSVSAQEDGVFNISSGAPVSVRSLVERWIRENNWNIALNLGHYPYPDYEPMAFWGSE